MKARKQLGALAPEGFLEYMRRTRERPRGPKAYSKDEIAERAAKMGLDAARKSKPRLSKEALKQFDQNA